MKLKLRKWSSLKKHEKINDLYVHGILYIKIHHPHVQQFFCTWNETSFVFGSTMMMVSKRCLWYPEGAGPNGFPNAIHNDI